MLWTDEKIIEFAKEMKIDIPKITDENRKKIVRKICTKLKDNRKKIPNLRVASKWMQSCGTCVHGDRYGSLCRKYNARVNALEVCDSWDAK